MSLLRLIYRVLREELRAIGWRFGIDRPKEIGTFVRYTAALSGPEFERIRAKLAARLYHLANLGKLEVTGAIPYWQRPRAHNVSTDPKAQFPLDPYDIVGSIGWKFRVR